MENNDLSNGDTIKRFSKLRIVEHAMVMLIFALLVITGLSQKFYFSDISQRVIFQIGGIDSARLIHRYSGLAFLAITFIHITSGITGILLGKWSPSMAITQKDFFDIVQNIRYYLSMENSPAPCGRYTYKQKFEYWSVIFSGLLMIITGLALWFPVFITGFLPGEVIPIAKVMHTNQALIIILILAFWHIYNSVFSPDVFPLDTTIFTGRISRERMSREHKIEYEKLRGLSAENFQNSKTINLAIKNLT